MAERRRAAGVPDDWRPRWQAIVGQVMRVSQERDLVALLSELSRPEATRVLAFVNAHAMNSIVASAPFFAALHAADVVLRDGSGMASLYRMLELDPGLNLNGTDLIPQIVRRFDGRPIALFGTREPWLGQAAASVGESLAPHSSLLTLDGFLPDDAYVDALRAQRPALIVLGMGMPRQEELAQRLRALAEVPCLIVCGGAIIDFLGGKTRRAPRWMQKSGVEWLFRLALEPRRLFMRYVVGNPLFLCRALRFRKQYRTGAVASAGRRA